MVQHADIDHTGLTGVGGGTPDAHAASHEDGGSDELEVTDLATSETDDELVLAPDGAGGVEWRAEVGGGGAPAVSYLGYNTVGGSTEGNTGNRWYFKQVTAPANGIILNVGAYVAGSTEGGQARFFAGVWTDASTAPRIFLGGHGEPGASIILMDAINGAGGLNPRWLETAVNIPVVASTAYWIGCSFMGTSANNFNLYKDGSGTDQYGPIVTGVVGDAGWSALTTSTDRYSFRALFMATS